MRGSEKFSSAWQDSDGVLECWAKNKIGKFPIHWFLHYSITPPCLAVALAKEDTPLLQEEVEISYVIGRPLPGVEPKPGPLGPDLHSLVTLGTLWGLSMAGVISREKDNSQVFSL